MLKFIFVVYLFIFPCMASYLCEDLTLDEKIGQLLLVHFNGEIVNEEAKTLVQTLHIGGIIYYNWANGLHSPEQVRQLSQDLQKLTEQNRLSIPLLLVVDQEGGVVNRLNQGFTIFPGNKALGMTEDLQLAEASAFAIGQELHAVGIHMNLSPVVDINNNLRNPIIGIRSFGDSASIVTSFAKKSLQGYHQAAILTCLKHFPGHGDVEVDSHEDLPVIKKSIEELQTLELVPFKELASQSDAIMTAHVMVPALDKKNCTTLSSPILRFLRHEIGFNGVIITDSLVMEALLKNCASIEEASIRALEAGCDLLMLGGKQLIGAHVNLELTVEDVKKIHQALAHAVKTGRISQERLNQAVQRILHLKQKYLSNESNESLEKDLKIETLMHLHAHQMLAKNIAHQALKTIENAPLNCPPFEQCHIAVFAPEFMHQSIQQISFISNGRNILPFFFKELNPNENEQQIAIKMAKKADLIVFCSYNAWKYPSQSFLIESLLNDSQKPMVLIALRDPLDAKLFSKIPLIFLTFSPTLFSVQATFDQLIKEFLK